MAQTSGKSFKPLSPCNHGFFGEKGTAGMPEVHEWNFISAASFSELMAEQQRPAAGLRRNYMSLGTIILIILIIALLGGFSGVGGGPFYGTGYYGGGGLGLIIVILLILLLLGKL
jgi:hypothetical protein